MGPSDRRIIVPLWKDLHGVDGVALRELRK